jgi:pyruvate/2-oxoglutarate dehydrogenase complex dihydrolipoamide dehydrogenase (E3) component
MQPEVIIAAVGAVPLNLSVPGIDGPQVFQCTDAVSGTLGNRVLIIGGGLVGCEYAIYLAMEGHEVILLEMRDQVAADCGWMYRTNLLHQLETAEVTIAAGLRCTEIGAGGLSSVDHEGNTHTFEADNILIAAGYRPETEVVESLRGMAPEFYVIGDAARPRNMMRAIREGYDAAVDLGL